MRHEAHKEEKMIETNERMNEKEEKKNKKSPLVFKNKIKKRISHEYLPGSSLMMHQLVTPELIIEYSQKDCICVDADMN